MDHGWVISGLDTACLALPEATRAATVERGPWLGRVADVLVHASTNVGAISDSCHLQAAVDYSEFVY